MAERHCMDIAHDILDAVLHAYGDVAAAQCETILGKAPTVRSVKRAAGDSRWSDKLPQALREEIKALVYVPNPRRKSLALPFTGRRP